jgi:two-component system chemotaxis response regulator CheB
MRRAHPFAKEVTKTPSTREPDSTVRVVIVDDSPFFRFQLGSRLSRRGWRVDASLASGEEAVLKVPTLKPDLVLMDVIMPGIGGMDAVRTLRHHWAGPIVMMSAASEQGISNTWRALDVGANDFIPKPSLGQPMDDMVDAIVARFRTLSHDDGLSAVRPSGSNEVRIAGIRALVIGASTGGPRALSDLFANLGVSSTIPIFIVQHMPAGFTYSFAQRLSSLFGSPVLEAPPDGSPVPLLGAPVVVAAGGRHLRISSTSCWCELGERRHGVIPSVDVTLFDAISVFGRNLGVVILTGMGDDGSQAVHLAHQLGAAIVVESKDSALVWGMPGTIAHNHDADAIWPLGRIGAWMRQVIAPGHGI